MQRINILGFIFLLLVSCGDKHQTGDKELLLVDQALDNTDRWQAEALRSVDSLEMIARYETNPNRKVELLIKISDFYQTFDLERALDYLLEANETVKKTTVSSRDSLMTLMRLASLFNSEGLMTKEASDIFNTLSPSGMDEELRLNYYLLGVQINKTLSDRAFAKILQRKYADKASEFRDSVLRIQPDNGIIAANKMVENGQIKEALAMMLSKPPSDDKNVRKGPYFHYLAGLYEQLERPDSQLYYLALAAEDDLRHGVREYVALTELADLLEETDLCRAYRYIEQSRHDALASHSSLRRRELGPIYQKINATYSERQRHLTVAVVIVSAALFIILIVVAFGIYILKKKNRELSQNQIQLQKSGNLLELANTELEETNAKLHHESQVKSTYINSFMELCLSYLGKMESFRARLGKIASEGDLKKVVDAINSSRYVNKEISEFYGNFDKAFLSLYPDFIQQLNGFLRDEERYNEVDKLTTELRVYALIRLGIYSSKEISKFLRCSESTVYNYRTQMRNRAIDRENFEDNFIKDSFDK